jgi:CRP/FNR family transcriptional regulator, cyclic AMP receptor protein
MPTKPPAPSEPADYRRWKARAAALTGHGVYQISDMFPRITSCEGDAAMLEDFLGLFRSETDVITLEPGQELFKKGDVGSHMYIVKSGEVQIVDGNHVFETVSAGGILGEMALISQEPRSATVRAISKSVVVPVDEKRFLFLVQQTPFFAVRVMRVMSARLRMMNDWVTALPKK